MIMAEHPTPGSQTSDKASVKLPKDKECIFCHQSFTSSSLGRHLDLYIKTKNPKPPDGLHDVEAIRRLRGSITRRQPRQQSRADGSTTSSSKATPVLERPSLPDPREMDLVDEEGRGPLKTYLHQGSWQATGSMNELPPTPRTEPGGWSGRRSVSSQRNVHGGGQKIGEDVDMADQGRAAELALKEVLENVKMAHQRAYPPTPFEFNFFDLSLPQIYLQCLNSPPELLLEAPLQPQDLAWSIRPPTKDHYEALRVWLRAKLSSWRERIDGMQLDDARLGGGKTSAESFAQTDKMEYQEPMYRRHLEKVYDKWISLSDDQRREQWHFECAKAFAREREQRKIIQTKLDHADLELAALGGRLDRIALDSPAADSRPYAATVFPLSREAVSHLPATTNLDHDALIAKWRGRLQSARNSYHLEAGKSLSHEQRRLPPIVAHRNSLPGHAGTSPGSAMLDEDCAQDYEASPISIGKRRNAKHHASGTQPMDLG